MSVFSNNRFLKRVNPEIVRAKDDSGSSLNHPEIQKLMRQMVDLGIADNLKLWVHSGLVKTRTSGSDTFVTKVYDISGNENDGVQATEANQPELKEKGLEYVLANSLNAGTGLSMTNNISVCGWINTSVSNRTWLPIASRWFFDNSRVWIIALNLGKIYAGVSNNGTVTGTGHKVYMSANTVNNGVWRHVGFTFATNIFKIFLDGTELTPDTSGGDHTVNSLLDDSDIIAQIGQWDVSASSYVGLLNDIRIFNKALSATKNSAIFNATKGFYGIT